MKKFVAMIFLITLISLSAALPNALNNQVGQVGFNSGAAILNPIIDSSSSANTVNIKSYSFQPATLNVPAGTTVTWHNQDNVQHTVTSDVQDLFDSGTIATGKKFTYTFQAPGSYSYHCSIHPGMKGTIIVAGTDANRQPNPYCRENSCLRPPSRESIRVRLRKIPGMEGLHHGAKSPLAVRRPP